MSKSNWNFEASAIVSSTSQAIWKHWTDVEQWKEWDVSLLDSKLLGPFAAGTQGEMTPQGMQTLTFELTEVVPLERFSDSTALPGAVIVFDHWLEQTAQGLKISHRVTLSGEAQESYVARMGAHLEHGLKNSVEKLAQLLERVRTGV